MLTTKGYRYIKNSAYVTLLGLCLTTTTAIAQKTKTADVVAAATMPAAATAITLTRADYKECFAFLDKLNKKASLDENLKAYNTFIAKRFGTKTVVTRAVLQARQRDRFRSTNGSIAILLDILKGKNKLSQPLYLFYKALDAKMLAIKTYKDGLAVMTAAHSDVTTGKYAFTKPELANLNAALTYLEASFEHLAGGPNGSTAMIAHGNEPCATSHWESEAELCEATFEGDEPFTHTTMILVEEPCEGAGGGGEIPETPSYDGPCRICPSNWVFEGPSNWTAATGYEYSCRAQFLAPRDPATNAYSSTFIYQNAFYYTPVSVSATNTNRCPSGGTFDGANCRYMTVPAGYVLARIEPGVIPRLFRVIAHCN